MIWILRVHIWLIRHISLKSLIRLLISDLIIIGLLLGLILILKLPNLILIALLLNSKINGLNILISFCVWKLRNSLIIQRFLVFIKTICILVCIFFIYTAIFWVISIFLFILSFKVDSFWDLIKLVFLIAVRIILNWCFWISCVFCALFYCLDELTFRIRFYIGTPNTLPKTKRFIFFILQRSAIDNISLFFGFCNNVFDKFVHFPVDWLCHLHI